MEGSVEEERCRDARQAGEPADACGQTQRAPLTVGVWLPEMESKDLVSGVQEDRGLSVNLTVDSPRKHFFSRSLTLRGSFTSNLN